MLVAFAAALLLAGILAGTALATLTPPPPFVLGADGKRHDLVDAGILKGPSTGGKTGSQWAIVLGKALFWDHQAGSDGQACAGCHFHAFADTRLRNQINPGFNDITKGADGDTAFGSERSDTGEVWPGHMPSGAVAGPNYVLKKGDMPGHKLVDETDRNSPIITTTNDRVSSQGAFDGTFTRVRILGRPDKCDPDAGVFYVKKGKYTYAARQVEPRATPSAVNAVFNHRNFWDGRANNLFNGVGTFGMRDIQGDPNKRLIVLNPDGSVSPGWVQVENASLASQAVAPPTSALEMSCDGRIFADVGRRLLFTIPLLQQQISRQDSVLGPYVSLTGKGLQLQYLYATLIMRAFDPKYWAAPGRYKIVNGAVVKDPTGYTQMEMNFSLFWGISIMLYESTLVSDQSPFDTLTTPVAQGGGGVTAGGIPGAPVPACTDPNGAADPLWLRGCNLFFGAPFGPPQTRGVGCVFCHTAPVFSENTFLGTPGSLNTAFTPFLNPVADVNGNNDIRDLGFASIGLRPWASDRLLGGTDPYGNPLSFGRQYRNDTVVDPFLQRSINNPVPCPGGFGGPPASDCIQGNIKSGAVSKLETDGAAKIPILRNVALTPPYFSWHQYPSLRQVLKVYNRGMNRRDIATDPRAANGNVCTTGDESGTGPDGNPPVHPNTGLPWPIAPLGGDCNTNASGLITPLGLLDCDANLPEGQVSAACAALGKDTTNDDLAALEVFMKSLTDPRVQCDVAPFDHPALTVFNGHTATDKNKDGKADDITFTLPAVGAGGYAHNSGYCIPNSADLFAPGMQSRSGGPKAPFLP